MSETNTQPSDGEVIPLWRAWPWVLQLAIGVFVAVGAAWLFDPQASALRRFLFWLEIVLGGALALVSAFNLLQSLRANPRLILDADRLRYVRGPRAFVDVPYDEIEDVGVDRYGWLVRCIGIHLAHPIGSPGEVTKSAEKAIRFLQRRFGYDAVIPADLPARRVEEIVQMIRTRVERAGAGDNP